MSRFWAGAESSDSDSSSESEDYSSDEDVGGGAGGGGAGGAGGGGANRWVDFSDSDSSDDDVRVAKSAKDRALDAFTAHIKALRQHMKDRDYHEIQTEFDVLAKDMIKAKKTLAEGVPRSLVKLLCDLEDYINDRQADRAAFRKLSARQGRALNRMKLTLKKHNKPFQVVMEHYRKNPDNDDDKDDGDMVDGDAVEDSDSDDSSSSNSSSSSSSSSNSGSSKKKDSDDDDDDDDDDAKNSVSPFLFGTDRRVNMWHHEDRPYCSFKRSRNSSFPTFLASCSITY
jgi:translation initiation factor 3 subunit C